MPTFIRFVVGADDEDHRQLTGLITETRLLRDKGVLTRAEEAELADIYVWFNANVPCPPFETAGWSRQAVSWFKDDAAEPIKKMRVLWAMLRQHDKPVRMLRSRNPGKILYDDYYQVVVEEWKKL